MILQSNIAKLGYYTVHGEIFLWKSDALTAAKNPKDVIYHFNDDIYNKFDWKHDPEPSTSIDELYRRRAQSLRDRYDYIIVMYSGGPDSKNILDVFVNNGIFIDEIVNINSYAQTGISDDTVHNADYINNVIPVLEDLQKSPGFKSKITILDEVELMKKHMAWTTKIGNHMMFGAQLLHGGTNMYFTKQIWTRYVDHIWKKIVNGVKLAVIIGADKPILTIENGRYGAVFGDLAQNGSGFSYYDDDYRYLDIMEPFYQSVETVDIIIKQSHILKQFMENNPDPQYYSIWKGNNKHRPSYSCPSKHGFGNLRYDIYHKLIYPSWKPGFVTPKINRMVLRKEDTWWLHQMHSEENKIFEYVLQKFIKDLRELTTSDVDLHKLSASHKTRPYFIE